MARSRQGIAFTSPDCRRTPPEADDVGKSYLVGVY